MFVLAVVPRTVQMRFSGMCVLSFLMMSEAALVHAPGGIIGSDGNTSDGIDAKGTVFEKLVTMKDTLTDTQGDLIAALQDIQGNVTATTQTNYGLLGSDNNGTNGAINSATNLYNKLVEVDKLIDDSDGTQEIVTGLQKILGKPNVLTPPQVDFGVIGDISQAPLSSSESDIFGKLSDTLNALHGIIMSVWPAGNGGPEYTHVTAPLDFQQLLERLNALIPSS